MIPNKIREINMRSSSVKTPYSKFCSKDLAYSSKICQDVSQHNFKRVPIQFDFEVHHSMNSKKFRKIDLSPSKYRQDKTLK